MPVNLTAAQHLAPVPGIRVAVTSLGVRKVERDDLTVFEIPAAATVAASFTRNAFCAAPVTLARSHLHVKTPRFLVINAGNANAGTGVPGMDAARRVCTLVAAAGGCAPEQVLLKA